MERRDFIKAGSLMSLGSVMGAKEILANNTVINPSMLFIAPNIHFDVLPTDRRNLLTHQRQVHLDFHTSPYLTDVGRDFNAAHFAKTVKEANINSITVFAKCHHGMSYYPTKTGVQHPPLEGRDLLGEMLEALLGKPFVGWGLSPSILSVPRKRDSDLIVTLLHYVPVRKCMDIDVIEQRMNFVDEVLYLSKKQVLFIVLQRVKAYAKAKMAALNYLMLKDVYCWR